MPSEITHRKDNKTLNTMTTPRYTATVRRYNGKTMDCEIDQKIMIPLDLYLESFADLWPFHRTHITGDRIVVDVYSTAERYKWHDADYFFSINPITA